MESIAQLSFVDDKLCRICNAWKCRAEFAKCNAEKDGLARRCRSCHKAYYQEHAERIKARILANHYKHQDREKQKSHAYYWSNREDQRAKRKMFRLQNAETIRQVKRDWRLAHLDYERDKHHQYYEDHKESIKQKVQKWAKARPDGVRVQLNHRRDAIDKTQQKLTNKEWRDICDHYGNICLCCGDAKKLTIDHIVPLSRGGTHDKENVQPLCWSCNSRKYTKTIDYRPDRNGI